MPTSWSATDQENDYTDAVLDALFPVIDQDSTDRPRDDVDPHPFRKIINKWSSVVLPLCEAVVALGPVASALPESISCALNPRRLARLLTAAVEGAKAVATKDARWRRRSSKADPKAGWTVQEVETVFACASALISRPAVWAALADDETSCVSVIEAVFTLVEMFSTSPVPRIESLGKGEPAFSFLLLFSSLFFSFLN